MKIFCLPAPNDDVTRRAFTLVEMAIVLVIIGLIVGGILVGRDLVNSSELNATITQVQKFNTSRAAFRLKYNALPGDMNNATATQFGFTPRGTGGGEGDGNGLIEGACQGGNHLGSYIGCGESVMYWVDLTSANGLNVNMIEGNFNTATVNTSPGTVPPGWTRIFPSLKLVAAICFMSGAAAARFKNSAGIIISGYPFRLI